VLVSSIAGAVWVLQDHVTVPRLLSLPAYALTGNLAAIHAGIEALIGDRNAVWEPTRRTTPARPPAAAGGAKDSKKAKVPAAQQPVPAVSEPSGR
jgi:hypothetical protein